MRDITPYVCRDSNRSGAMFPKDLQHVFVGGTRVNMGWLRLEGCLKL